MADAPCSPDDGGRRVDRKRRVDDLDQATIATGQAQALLVGDMAYFGQFGFHPAEPGQVVLPGPADPKRILWRAHRDGALDGVCGQARIAPPDAAET